MPLPVHGAELEIPTNLKSTGNLTTSKTSFERVGDSCEFQTSQRGRELCVGRRLNASNGIEGVEEAVSFGEERKRLFQQKRDSIQHIVSDGIREENKNAAHIGKHSPPPHRSWQQVKRYALIQRNQNSIESFESIGAIVVRKQNFLEVKKIGFRLQCAPPDLKSTINN